MHYSVQTVFSCKMTAQKSNRLQQNYTQKSRRDRQTHTDIHRHMDICCLNKTFLTQHRWYTNTVEIKNILTRHISHASTCSNAPKCNMGISSEATQQSSGEAASWMTLNDLERRNSPYFAFLIKFDGFAGQLRHSG